MVFENFNQEVWRFEDVTDIYGFNFRFAILRDLETIKSLIRIRHELNVIRFRYSMFVAREYGFLDSERMINEFTRSSLFLSETEISDAIF